MERISFVNGEFLPHSQCFVHIEDRGFQFADGVYEVILFKNTKLIDFDWHAQRLFRSLGELQIKFSQDQNWLEKMILELFAKNNLAEGSVYLQITRGWVSRQQGIPKDLNPTITATVSPLKPSNHNESIKAITHPDIRWERCDIKSTALLASSWIRQKAFDAGADDAILVRDGFVTEATFANVFIVDEYGSLITREANNFILCGITRNRIIDLARKYGIRVVERKFSAQEMMNAKEVFLSSTTLFVRPVSNIDGNIIEDGRVGEVSKCLLNLYQEFLEK
jgi:D-alanine transaminase